MQAETVLSNLNNQWVSYIGFVIFHVLGQNIKKKTKRLTVNYKYIEK